jgi:hypothetical protein
MGSTTIVRSHPPVTESEEGTRPGSEEVKIQLALLLASPLFHHSKHYTSFLRYVVNETLEGHGGHLKERALGVEVFGRGAHYDTNADPVVRTSACEVRKRIAQYYHEPGHEQEIRIDLPSGSYIPEFRYPVASLRPLALVVESPPAPGPRELILQWVRQKRAFLALGVALAVAAGAGIAVWPERAPAAIQRFWSPVWGSADSAMLAMGNPALPVSPPAPFPAVEGGPSFLEVMKADNLAFSDALTMARITGIFREYGKKKLDVRRGTAFTLTDLRKGPLILVGAFNNPWTMRLTKDLRFTYEPQENHVGAIRDRQTASNNRWTYDPNLPYSKITQDYAMVSRFVDPLTERMVVVVGGMGRDGTLAAGEFVTEPRYLEMLASRAPRNWEKKNLQVVLATDVVRGNTGPPRILATYFW